MKKLCINTCAAAMVLGVLVPCASQAATLVQIGHSGKTYASSAPTCGANATGTLLPVVEAGLFNPKKGATAVVSLDGSSVTTVTTATPATNVWLGSGNHVVTVALGKKDADSYVFNVAPNTCDNSGNTLSADGTLEYAASGKTYATVTPGCAWNSATGTGQPYVNLFDGQDASGHYYLVNVSVNDVPLTQLGSTRRSTPVFLAAGSNVIAAANGSLSTDYYVRNGGDGTCALP